MIQRIALGLAVLISLGLAYSCNKGPALYTIKGNISDGTMGGSISNQLVKVATTNAGSSSELNYLDLTTDAEGNYTFEIERAKFEKVNIKVVKDLYFEGTSSKNIDDLSSENDNIVDIKINAKAWVKLTFNNPGGNPTDELTYIMQDGKKGCTECCSTAEQKIIGAGTTEVICINDGNMDYSIYYFQTGGGPSDIVATYTAAFDTAAIVINY
jgi:hypothetical protein